MARLPDPAVYTRWSRLIQRHQQSDLTIADFCDQHGVSTASFYQWRRKIRKQAQQRGEFFAVEVGLPRESTRDVTVRFPCGTQIELDAADTDNLRLVIDRLAARNVEAQQ